jgi:hypothetical protein
MKPGTRFFDVEGVPVRIEPAADGGLSVFAFDPLPRFFPLFSVLRTGAEITRETFDEMVKECAAAKSLAQGADAVFEKRDAASWPHDD